MPFNQLKFKGMAFVFYDRIVIYSKMKKKIIQLVMCRVLKSHFRVGISNQF